jgi:UDP-glucuronate 4-epimerase
VLEEAIGAKAEKVLMDLQPGDVVETYADVSDLERMIDFRPATSIEEGLGKFVDWYREYHNR